MLQIADDLKCQIVNYDAKQHHFYLEHHERFWFRKFNGIQSAVFSTSLKSAS